MQYVRLFVSMMVALPAMAQVTGDLTIANYRYVGEERRISSTVSDYDLRADVTNTGAARASLTATIVGISANVVPLQGILRFGAIPTGATVSSTNAITLRVDRALPFEVNTIVWNFSNIRAPSAVAGPNQTVAVSATVYLNGSGSTSPPGSGALTYSWAFIIRPIPSAAAIVNPNSVNPTFVTDAAGVYGIRLTVTNLGASDSSVVYISTGNSIPVANAGRNQSVGLTTLVQLDGSRSSDINGDALTYLWSFVSRPAGSTAALNTPTLVMPQFRVDRAGTYVIQLVVSDGRNDSSPEMVTISTRNTAPVANAGPAQSGALNSTVQLTGAGSTDVDGDALTYLWSWNSVPTGSVAAFSSPTAVNPTFTLDRPGTYVAQLIVNDWNSNSTPVTVTISSNSIQPPTANPGLGQSVQQGALVTLNATGTDPQNQPLTYTWSLTTRPTNSNAVLSNPASARPTFTADKAGLFVAQLIANNSYLDSAPVTVNINTSGTAPVGNAGAAQSVNLGVLVSLNGSGSSDADGDALTYSWSFTSRPAGSTATLAAPTSATPTLMADRLGTYVVQLIVNDGFYASLPVTVTLQVRATLTFSPTSLTFDDRAPGSFTIRLSGPAPVGGLTVNLVSTNPSVVTVPATVSFAQSATTANIEVTPVTPGGTSVIRASLLPDVAEATANVTLNRQDILLPANVSVAPADQVSFNVSLANPAAAATTVTLQVSDPTKATFSAATVQFNAGQTQPVAQPRLNGLAGGTVTVTATAPTLNTAVTTVAVTGSLLGAILLPTAATMTQAQVLDYPIALTVPAAAGGVTVNLSSNASNVVAISPTSVTIPPGQTQASVVARVTAGALGTATITATASGFGPMTRGIQVTVPLAPTAAPGANQTVPQGAVVALAGTGTDPQSLPLTYAWSLTSKPSGSAAVLSSTLANPTFSPDLPGSYTLQLVVNNGYVSSAPASLTVTVTDRGILQLPATASVALGTPGTLALTLSTPAPVGGVVVTLTNSNPTLVQINPQSVEILAGATAPSTPVVVQGLELGTVTIGATALGYSPASQAMTATNRGNLLLPATASLALGTPGTLALTLSTPAPVGGVVVTLTNSNPTLVEIPVSVEIAAGATAPSGPVVVRGLELGTVTIGVTARGYNSASQTTTATNRGNLLLPATVSLALGTPGTLDLTLSTPAPVGGVVVTLTNSNPTLVEIPVSVEILAGATTPSAPIAVRGLELGTVTIGATARGYNSASQTTTATNRGNLLLPATVSLALGTPGTLDLTLSTPAPVGGVVVTLTNSNPTLVEIPVSVEILAGATAPNAPVVVRGLQLGTVTIGATARGYNSASQTTTATNRGNLLLPATLSMVLGTPGTLALTLSAPAPAGGTVVTLTNSNPARVQIPVSVEFAAGATTPTTPVAVQGLDLGTVTIGATAWGYAPASQTTTVSNRGNLQLPATVSMVLGTQGTLALTLSAPAPAGGTVVNLASSNPARVQITPRVDFAAGATTPSSPVVVQGLDLGTATIGATAWGYAPASQTTTVGASLSLTPNTVTFVDTGTRNLTVVLSGPAPARGLTMNVSSTNPAVATVPSTVTFAAGSATTSLVVTGVAPGSAVIRVGSAELAETTANITFSPPDINLPMNLVVPVGEQVTFPITLQRPSVGTTFVEVTSSDPSRASLSIQNVVFNEGQTTPLSQARITGWNAGSVTVSVSAVGLNPTRTVVRVGLGLSFPSPTLAVTGTATENILLSLSGPAPQGGVTVTLTSSNPSVASVPQTLVFSATTTAVTVPVTGVSAGSVTINVTSAQAGDASLGVVVSSTVVSGAIVLPAAAPMIPGQTMNFPVTLSTPAGAGGVVVSLASSGGAVSVSPLTVTVPAGQTQSATVPLLTAVSVGSANISATGTGYTSASRTVTVAAAPPALVIASSGSGQSALVNTSFGSPLVALVRDGQGNAMSGVTVTFSAPFSGAGASLSATTGVTNLSGLASSALPVANGMAGAYVVSASVAGVASPATFSLTNTAPVVPPPSGGGGGGGGNSISLAPVTVGQNLQTLMTLTLPNVAPAGGQRVTIASSDPGSVLVAGRPTDAGSSQLTSNVGEGSATASFYVQGLTSSGISNVTVTSAGLNSGVGTVTLAPSGFVLSGPNSPATQSFTLGLGSNVGLTVSAARLDGSLNFAESQQIRGGLSVQVSITNVPGLVGALVPNTVTIAGGNASAAATFSAVGSPGIALLTAVGPTGYSLPGAGADALVATVTSATMITTAVTLGENLQTTTNIRLNAPSPAAGMRVTITSGDPGKVMFATSATAVGSSSITIEIPTGRTASADFYVQGLANNGVVNFRASSPGFGDVNGSVTLTRSSFVVSGPFGVGTDFFTTTGAASSPLTLRSTRLDASFNPVDPQAVRGGLTLDVAMASATPATGTITGSPVRFTGGVGTATAQFQPAGVGTSLISLTPPTGFSSAASGGSLTVTVRVPGLVIEDNVMVGSNLQAPGNLLLGQAVPVGGLTVTLSSNSPNLLLSATEDGAGASSINLALNAGQISAIYYLQGRASSGTATYTATASGYQVRTSTVNLAPSGLIITGPFGIGFPLAITLSGGTRPATVTTALLDPSTNAFVQGQALAGGLTLTIPLGNSSPTRASLPGQVVMTGGMSAVEVPIQPLASGTTLISLPAPLAGFSLPRSATSLTVQVTN